MVSLYTLSKDVVMARNFAKEAHKGQKDDVGLDYFSTHIEQVFDILIQVTEDETILKGAYLHDVIEDTNITYEEIKDFFGVEVADLVMEVTHEGTKKTGGYYFPRLSTYRGYLLKFADRLSNISRMDVWDNTRKTQYLVRSRFWKSEKGEPPNPILVPISLGEEE